MKTRSILQHLLAVLLTIQFGFVSTSNINAQKSEASELTSPIHGKLVLVGTGELSSRVLSTFSYIAVEGNGSLVILTI